MTPAPVNPDGDRGRAKARRCAAKKVEAMSGHVRQLADNLMSRVVEGWNSDAPGNLANLRLQTAFIGGIRQIFTLTKRIARVFSNEPGGASGTTTQ